MDIESIRKNYRNLEDYQIVDLANTSANSLRPEIIPLLEEEIKRRDLSEKLLNGIQAQLKTPSLIEIDEYCSIIRNQSCSECHSKTHKLNAIILKDVASLILLTRTNTSLKIACPDCLEKYKKNSNSRTLLLGWWALPWGPIKTIQTLVSNSIIFNKIRKNEPTDILKSFVYENIGTLETNKDNPNALKHLLIRTNNLV